MTIDDDVLEALRPRQNQKPQARARCFTSQFAISVHGNPGHNCIREEAINYMLFDTIDGMKAFLQVSTYTIQVSDASYRP